MWEPQDLWQLANIACWEMDSSGQPLTSNNIKHKVLDRIRSAVPGSRAHGVKEWPQFPEAMSHDDELAARDCLRKLARQLTEQQRLLAVDYWLWELTLAELGSKHRLSEWSVRRELAHVRAVALKCHQ